MIDVETIRWKLKEMIAEMVENRAAHVTCIERIDHELSDARIALTAIIAPTTTTVVTVAEPIVNRPRPVEVPSAKVHRQRRPCAVKLVLSDVLAHVEEAGPQTRLAILRHFNIYDGRAGVSLHAWAKGGRLTLRDGCFGSPQSREWSDVSAQAIG